MKLNLHPKGIPKQEPLGADTPLKKGGVVVGMRKEGDKEKIYFVGDDCHLLCVGATRSGKSRCLVLESICLLGKFCLRFHVLRYCCSFQCALPVLSGPSGFFPGAFDR